MQGYQTKKLTHEGVEELVPYPPGKPIEELERELGIKGSIKLASNENPLGPSPLAVKALKEKLGNLHRYPDGGGYYLKTKLSEFYEIPRDQVILGNGSNELIELAIRTFLSPGEQAIQAFPTFLVYEKFVKAAGGIMTSVPLLAFKVDLVGLSKAVSPNTKMVFINNPNNPTGTALSRNELSDFLKRLPREVILVLDEAYVEFASDMAQGSSIELLKEHPLTIIVRTFSKLYGLAGLRIGYGFSSPEVIDYMNRVRQPFNANSLAQAAATAAIDDREFVSQTLELVKNGLKFLYSQLKAIGLEFIPTQTNFFLIKVPHGGRETYERLLKEGVIVRSMESYGLSEYIRINVGLPEENERFIRTLRKVLG